jgi:hypothetical protein
VRQIALAAPIGFTFTTVGVSLRTLLGSFEWHGLGGLLLSGLFGAGLFVLCTAFAIFWEKAWAKTGF